MGEFAPEDIPAKETLTRFAKWTAPELMDHEAFWKIRVDNYRDHEYRGEYKQESDIFAMGCTALEVVSYFSFAPTVLDIYPYLLFSLTDIHGNAASTLIYPIPERQVVCRPY